MLLEVADTGTGMPPEIMEKIFEPFFSTKEVGKGTGLGLSTVYGIVKQTGGYIYVDSKPGRGGDLPHPPSRATCRSRRRSRRRRSGRAAPSDLTGSARILLVEDEEAVRAFAGRALTARGYTVYRGGLGPGGARPDERHAASRSTSSSPTW